LARTRIISSVLHRLHVRDVISRDVASVPTSTRFEDILRLVVESPHVRFYVVDDRGDLLGAISLSLLRQLFLDREGARHVMVAGDLADPNPPTVTEDEDLDTAMLILGISGLEEIAAAAPANSRRLVGTPTSQRMIEAYNADVLRRDLAGGVSSTLGVTERARQVALGGGDVVQEIDAPTSLLRAQPARARGELAPRRPSGADPHRTPSDPTRRAAYEFPPPPSASARATPWS
jgi:CBS domain-containing protein